MKALSLFAKMLKLPEHRAEDALHSDAAARLVVSRRFFLGATGAGLAALALRPGEVEAVLPKGQPYSFAKAPPLSSVHLVEEGGRILKRWYPGERIESFFIGSAGARRAGKSFLSSPDRIRLLRFERVGGTRPSVLQQILLHPSANYLWVSSYEGPIIA